MILLSNFWVLSIPEVLSAFRDIQIVSPTIGLL